MRVVYETPIWQKITSARVAAEQTGQRIDYVELTKDEMRELYHHVRVTSFWVPMPGSLTAYDSVRVKEVA